MRYTKTISSRYWSLVEVIHSWERSGGQSLFSRSSTRQSYGKWNRL